MTIIIKDFKGNEIRLNKELLKDMFPHSIEDISNYIETMKTLGLNEISKTIYGKIQMYIHI